MTKKRIAMFAVVAVLVASVGMLVAQPGTTDAAQEKGDVQIDLLIQLSEGKDGSRATLGEIKSAISNIGSSGLDGVSFQVDSFFDIEWSRVSNIGSSGLDGVSMSSFQVDSFFDIEYRIDLSDDPSTARTIQTEMLSMSLTSRVGDHSDSGAVLVAIEKGLAFLDMGDTTVGHVTVLK